MLQFAIRSPAISISRMHLNPAACLSPMPGTFAQPSACCPTVPMTSWWVFNLDPDPAHSPAAASDCFCGLQDLVASCSPVLRMECIHSRLSLGLQGLSLWARVLRPPLRSSGFASVPSSQQSCRCFNKGTSLRQRIWSQILTGSPLLPL